MDYVLPVIMLLVGLATGAGSCWLVMSTRLRHQVDKAIAASESHRSALEERLTARDSRIEELKASLQVKEAECQEQRRTILESKQKIAQLTELVQNERERAQEKLTVLNEAKQKLSDAFTALAAEALKSNNQSFLELAKTTLEKYQETAKGDLEKRQQAITELVKPVKESLEKVDSRIQDLEKAREGAYAALNEQVKNLLETQQQLRSETSNLVKALRTPNVRGRWGEIQLRRVVELAGMVQHCDFFEQHSVDTDDGVLRPDLIVRLPGQKVIVVDAKVPLEGYLAAVEAPDDDLRKQKLADHARQVRSHMSSLGKKSYFQQFDCTPEFVVLFLPGESFFSAALQHDPSLIEFGVEQKVIVATPTTLIALLRAVAYGWTSEQLARNAQEISQLGQELYKRLSNMGEHFDKVGRSLAGAVDSYNRAVGSIESRVLVTARKFPELGIAAGSNELAELTPLESVPRRLEAPELQSGHDSQSTSNPTEIIGRAIRKPDEYSS